MRKIFFITISILTNAVLCSAQVTFEEPPAPVTFRAGETISADQLNDQFSKVSTVIRGYKSALDILGTWSCTTYSSRGPGQCISAFTTDSSGFQTATQTVVFAHSGSNYTWSASSFDPGNCTSTGASSTYKSGCYMLANGKLASDYQCGGGGGIYGVYRKAPNAFLWDKATSLPQNEFTFCVKQDIPPSFPTNLTGAIANGTVTLNWTAPSSADQVGYKVARKTTLTGTYVDVGTPTNNTYSDALTAGTYWYRVRSTNANGDSLGSNEIVVFVP